MVLLIIPENSLSSINLHPTFTIKQINNLVCWYSGITLKIISFVIFVWLAKLWGYYSWVGVRMTQRQNDTVRQFYTTTK